MAQNHKEMNSKGQGIIWPMSIVLRGLKESHRVLSNIGNVLAEDLEPIIKDLEKQLEELNHGR